MEFASRPLEQITSAADWRQLFEVVFASSGCAIGIFDERQCILAVNDAGLALIQRERDEVLGVNALELVAAAEHEAERAAWATLRSVGNASGTRTLVRRDGTHVACDWEAQRVELQGREAYVRLAKARTPATEMRLDDRVNLSSREREVVFLLASGADSVEIATHLVISPETVKTHVRNAMVKLGARTRAQLVARALWAGQIEPVSD